MRTRSPFPGMDPWLESLWADVRHTIISNLRHQIFSQLPAGLYAAIEENVYVVDAEPDRQVYRPDVGIFDSAGEVRVSRGTSDRGVAVAEPIILTFPSEPIAEGHIEIRDLREGNPRITVVEVLSPTNKVDSRGRAAYSAKRDSYVRAGVNILEIDLLRAGEHLVAVPAEYLHQPSVAPYKCVIRRSNTTTQVRVDYFPISLRNRLPRLPLPLRPSDADVVVDLQEPIRIAYGVTGDQLNFSAFFA